MSAVLRALAVAERRALLIGVSGFTEAADESLVDLDFAAPVIEELSEVLRDSFGYSVTAMTEPGLTSIQLSEAVRQAIVAAGQDDIFLLHLLTHGVARGNLLYALGSDGNIDERAEVGTWLAGLQHAHGRPLGLLSLDMCHSGIVTQLPWQAVTRAADGEAGSSPPASPTAAHLTACSLARLRPCCASWPKATLRSTWTVSSYRCKPWLARSAARS